MTVKNWQPDTDVVRQIREAVKQFPNKLPRISNTNSTILNWADVIREIENGTEFGQKFYNAYLEALKRQ